MNYEEMSDFEINKAVLLLKDFNYYQYVCLEEGERVYLCEHDEHDLTLDISRELFDPCNNPSDAWPIIVENQIDVISPTTGGTIPHWQAEKWSPDNKPTISALDLNPLRSAMIVYLMMQEDK
jgi:hypothetical protein